jgi:hypothetical protein
MIIFGKTSDAQHMRILLGFVSNRLSKWEFSSVPLWKSLNYNGGGGSRRMPLPPP